MRLKIRIDRSKPGVWVSGVAHAAMLGAAVFAFTAPSFPEAQEGIPVEFVTDNQLSQITKGEETAKAVQPNPKPRADRVADTRQPRDPGEAQKDTPAPPRRPADMKVADREVEAAAAPPPPPRPEAREEAKREEAARAAKAAAAELAREKAAEAKAQAAREEKAKAEAQAEAIEQAKAEAEARAEARRAAEAKAKAEAAKEVAEAKAKADAKAKAEEAAEAKAKAEAEAKAVAEAKAKAEADAKAKAVAAAKAKAEADARKLAEAKEAEAKARRQAEVADKFDAGDIRQLLQSKERAQSSGATGSEVNKTASLGTAAGLSQRLSPSMRDSFLGLLRDQIERCYSAPVAASVGNVTNPFIDLRLNPDGTLAGEPRVLRAGSSSLDRAVADAALRAVRRCAPYRVPAQFAPYHNDWKAINVEFEPPRA